MSAADRHIFSQTRAAQRRDMHGQRALISETVASSANNWWM